MLEFIQEFLNKLKKARLRKDQNLQFIVQQEFMQGQIRQQIVDIVAQNDEYKKQLTEEVRDLQKAEGRLDRLQDDLIFYEDQVEGNANNQDNTGGIKIRKAKTLMASNLKEQNLDNRKALREQTYQDKKLQQEKDLMLGLDYIQNVRLTLLVQRNETIFSKVLELWDKFMDFITPFKSHMKVIKSRHILSIQAAFIFMRNLVSASIS